MIQNLSILLGKYKNSKTPVEPWFAYGKNILEVNIFHSTLAKYYHPITYVHYGASVAKFSVWGDLLWKNAQGLSINKDALQSAKPEKGSNPVKVLGVNFAIVDAKDMGYDQPGDGTVPISSGEAPYRQGGDNVKQSFRMEDFDHQDAYNDSLVQNATLYAIGKILQGAK